MLQPEGLTITDKKNKVCKLRKSLYGLKQAPKQWHDKFDQVILSDGFSSVSVDKCVYTKTSDNEYVIISLYVDDMLIFGSSMNIVHSTKHFLASKFDMKDMGEASVILGIKIVRSNKDGEEVVYLGDSRTTNVLGKGKVILKLTSGKTLVLNEVLHVPNIRANLVSVAVLGKFGIKVSFESDKIVMTKNNVFVGKGYCNHGLFVLNVAENMNENASSSAYLLDSYDLWHARLGHVSQSYLKKMNSLGLISSSNYSSMNKCEVCVEAKITKKTCTSVKRETDLLNLMHTDLGDLKQTMTRGGKKYYVTFIDDFSRYTKLYLLRSKDEAYSMFLLYKAEVENQLNKKNQKS
jgi:hypothetical protein